MNAELEPRPGLIGRVVQHKRNIGMALVLALGLNPNVAEAASSSADSFAESSANGGEFTAAATYDPNTYPYLNDPCLSGDSNDPNSSYGKTSGPCEPGRWGDLATRNYKDEDGYLRRTCVSGANYIAQAVTGINVPPGLGSAKEWDNNAPSHWTVDNTPAVGDIAVSEGLTENDSGHVGVVLDKLPNNGIGIGDFNKHGTGQYAYSVYYPDASGVYPLGRQSKWNHFITMRSAASNEPAPSPTTVQPSEPAPATSSSGDGYWLVTENGYVHGFGDAVLLGGPGPKAGRSVDMDSAPDARGYWVINEAGQVFGFGSAKHLGNLSSVRPGEKAVSIAVTPSGKGYWIGTSTGRIEAFGDAKKISGVNQLKLAASILDMSATPSGEGLRLVGSDGGVFSLGGAPFFGSMGGKPLNKPVEALAPTPTGKGYWLVASDGGIFSFGDAVFGGSMGGQHLNQPIEDMIVNQKGKGYWLIAGDGGVFALGGAPFKGSTGNIRLSAPVAGATPVR